VDSRMLKKASGPDKISHKMLKIAPEKIAEPLQIIFNKSLRQGKYPSSWKIAHVIAIFKKGDASFRKKDRLILIYKFVSNKIIINIFIDYSLHNFTNATYQRYRTVI
jgi:hypothetical protein